MADTDATLKLTTQSEIQELIAYTKAVRDLAAAQQELAAAMANTNQASGVGGQPATVGGGGAATGAPPPAPTAPPKAPAAGGAGVGGPPSAPRNPNSPNGQPTLGPQQQIPGILPPSGGAATGAPPPPPLAPSGPAGYPRAANGQFLPRGGGGGGSSGGPSGLWDPFSEGIPGLGRGAMAAGSMAITAGGMGMALAGRGLQMAGGVANQALNVGLGSDLFGLPLTALNRYMQLSVVMTQVDRKFRDAAGSAQWFGQSLGYGREKSAQLAESLGRSTNSIDRHEATGILGFARFTGADPSATLSGLGALGNLGGSRIGSQDLARVLAAAKTAGMDQGRLDEFLGRLESTGRQQFGATGSTSVRGALNVQGLQSVVYGAEDPRRANDTTMLGGLNSVMTGGGAMRTYMMRAMGYGKAGGPDYISMRERLDAGINDPKNVIDLFSSFQQSGMGRGAQFRALESVSGGQLKANQIAALVDSLGTSGGLAKYQDLIRKGGTGADALKGILSPSELKTFEGSGFGGLGLKGISAGESYQNRIESMMMQVGPEVAKSIPALQGTIESMMRMLSDLTGGHLGDKIADAAHAIQVLTETIERQSKSPLMQLHNDPTAAHAGDVLMQGVLGIQPLPPQTSERPVRYTGESVHPYRDPSLGPAPPLGVHHTRGGGGPR